MAVIIDGVGTALVFNESSITLGQITLKSGLDSTVASCGAGTAATALRTALASDDLAVASLSVMDDWDESDRAKVNIIAGQVGVAGGSGTVSALTQRMVLATDVALPAGEAHIGETTKSAIAITPIITASASPDYTAGDVLGTTLTLTNAARTSGGLTRLKDVFLTDDAAQTITGNILIFDSAPAGTYTDNAACPDLTTDEAKLVGRIPVASGDWATVGTVGIAHIAVDKLYKASGSANLIAVFVVTSTPNLAATTDIRATFNFERY